MDVQTSDAQEPKTELELQADQLLQAEQEANATKELIAKGKAQGYLTYDEVNACLPDEDVSPEKLDTLLVALEEVGIELVEEAPEEGFDGQGIPKAPSADDLQSKSDDVQLIPTEELPKLSDDPIRMYLSQMSVIPLLDREQEVVLAKKIEVARRKYRHSVISCNYAMAATIETLKRVSNRINSGATCSSGVLRVKFINATCYQFFFSCRLF